MGNEEQSRNKIWGNVIKTITIMLISSFMVVVILNIYSSIYSGWAKNIFALHMKKVIIRTIWLVSKNNDKLWSKHKTCGGWGIDSVGKVLPFKYGGLSLDLQDLHKSWAHQCMPITLVWGNQRQEILGGSLVSESSQMMIFRLSKRPGLQNLRYRKKWEKVSSDTSV